MYRGAPWPIHEDDELAAAMEVLKSGKTNYWTGRVGRTFEQAFAQEMGVRHAVFVSNGTVALELALRSLQLEPGSQVVTTPRTYVATAMSIAVCGLRPVFADVDPLSGNITPESASAVMTPRTSAILVVHSSGWPADMHGFRSLCDSRSIALIEDCAQAHGALINGRSVGTFGDVSAWSFCQDKIISTGGEGGMVTTNNGVLADWAWSYKDHGKSWTKVYQVDHPPGFRWLHDSLGSNMRGTEVQAAIGMTQLKKLPEWHRQRQTNARLLADAVADIPGIECPLPDVHYEHAFYRLNARFRASGETVSLSRDDLLVSLNRRGLPALSGSCSEVYREEAFRLLGQPEFAPQPEAQRWTEESLAFLVHPGLTPSDLLSVAEGLREVICD